MHLIERDEKWFNWMVSNVQTYIKGIFIFFYNLKL